MKYDYALLDSGNFKKLEQVGPYRMIRPCLQAIWGPSSKKKWEADFEFLRFKDGKSEWKKNKKKLPETWEVHLGARQKSIIKLTDFGHLGFFPEHHAHRDFIDHALSKKKTNESFKILNLFAYTGALSLLSADLGAQVTHLDASKKSIDWAKENLEVSSLKADSIRWITDDVMKFVQREKRRNSFYDAVILDPPTFGRGTKGEVWKIEEHLPLLLKEISQILKKDFSFVILSSHTPGHTPLVLNNLLSEALDKKGKLDSFELSLTEKNSGRLLPSGACSIYTRS